MGINRYMLPALHNPGQSYVPQYVPLPIEDLDKALNKVETDLTNQKKGLIAFGDKEWNNLSPDQKRYHELRTELDADVDEAVNLALSDVMGPGKRSAVKRHLADMTRKWSKQFKKGGEAHAMDSNYKQRADLKKAFEEKGIPKHTIEDYMRAYDSQYAHNLGIGTKSEQGAFNPYGSMNIAKHVDVVKKLNTLAKEMDPIVLKNTRPGTGIWLTMEDFFEPGQLKWWQQQMTKTDEEVRKLTPKMISQAMTNAIMMDGEMMDYIYQDVIGRTAYKTGENERGGAYYKLRQRGDDQLEADVKQEIANYANTLAGIHRQYEYRKDEQQHIANYPEKYLEGRDEKTGRKKDDLIIEYTTDVIQTNNQITSNTDADKQVVNGDDIVESIDATITDSNKNLKTTVNGINDQIKTATGGSVDDPGMFDNEEQFLRSVEAWAATGFDTNSDAAIPGMSGDVASEYASKIENERQKIENANQLKLEVNEWVDNALGKDKLKLLEPEAVIEKAVYNGENIISNIADNSATLTDEKVVEAFDALQTSDDHDPYYKNKDLEVKLEGLTSELNKLNDEQYQNFLNTGKLPQYPDISGYGEFVLPISESYYKTLKNNGYNKEDIGDLFQSIQGFDNNIAQKDQQDILSNIYDEREGVLKDKQKLRKDYVAKHPNSKYINREQSIMNAVPFYKATYTPEGVKDIVLDKTKSKEAIEEIDKYIDIVKTRPDLQWSGINVNDEGVKEKEKKTTYQNWLKENEANIEDVTKDIKRTKPMYGDFVYYNTETESWEPGYQVTESIKTADGGLSQITFTIPGDIIDPYKWNKTEEDPVLAKASLRWKAMKNDILDIGMSTPWKDKYSKYMGYSTIQNYALDKDFEAINSKLKQLNYKIKSGNYSQDELREHQLLTKKIGTLMSKYGNESTQVPAQFKNVNGELRMINNSFDASFNKFEKDGNEVVFFEGKLDKNRMLSEKQTRERMMNIFINDEVLSGQSINMNGNTFSGTVMNGERVIVANFRDGKRKIGKNIWEIYAAWREEKKQELKDKQNE